MFPFFPLVALAAAFMAVLNALGYFFIPGFSSALFNLVSIITGVAASKWIENQGPLGPFTVPIEGMAIGVILGGLAQAGLQWPLLHKNGFSFRYFKGTWMKDPALRQMLFLMVPGTLGLAATQINILVNSILATSVGIGAVSWLNYAFRLMQFPIGVFGVSLAQANLSVFSKHWANNEKQKALDTLSQTLRQTLAVNFPAASGLIALGSPIIAMIFQHGRFSFQDTEKTALVLSAYSVGLVGYSLVKVWVPVFYALGNTRIPVVSSVLSVALNLGLNLCLVRWVGLVGLPLGVSGVAIFNAIFLVWAGQKEFLRHSLRFPTASFFRSVWIHFFFSLGVGLSAGGVAFGIRHFWPDFSQSFVGHLVQVSTGIGASLCVWVFMGEFFQISEVRDVFKIFLKKMKRKQ
jgi:putative peptidoglycan lipid II flippase